MHTNLFLISDEDDMSRKDLARQWDDLSADWIRESRGRNANRKGLLDQPIISACGDVTGLRVVDCGCGEGRFSRLLAKRGVAYVLGLDSCIPMIEAANALKSDVDQYRIADVQNLDFLEEDSFDLAVSHLNQCDLPDFESNTRGVFRILRPGGRFVIANLHPMRTGADGWHKDETGKKLHAILDNYFDESERTWEIWEKPLTNFHRTLSTYLDGFIKAGFELVQIIEPTVSPENLEKYPELADELRVPNFIIYVMNKPI